MQAENDAVEDPSGWLGSNTAAISRRRLQLFVLSMAALSAFRIVVYLLAPTETTLRADEVSIAEERNFWVGEEFGAWVDDAHGLKSGALAPANGVSCVWKPNDDDPCVNQTLARIRASLEIPLEHHRWLFFGDSTMWRLFVAGGVGPYLFDDAPIQRTCPGYLCSTVSVGRCETNEVLNLTKPRHWSPPNFTKSEGPLAFGAKNPFCHDCTGCESAVIYCESDATYTPCPHTSSSRGLYGSYLSVEFARDVEIQSELYDTTQQNLVHYVERDWNAGRAVRDFGLPICVVSTGHHDVGISNVTLAGYLSNVEWFVDLLSAQCDHIIWLSNNCPRAESYEQKMNKTQEWNLGVRDRLHRRNNTSFVDIFEASIMYHHADNIHMDNTWYKLLGAMFLKIIRSSTP